MCEKTRVLVFCKELSVLCLGSVRGAMLIMEGKRLLLETGDSDWLSEANYSKVYQ